MRTLSQEHGVSISTVQQAYRLLEEQRLVEARPKSGYFVHTQRAQAELPAMTAPVQRPVDISQWEQVLELVRSRPREGLIQLGRGMPDIAEPTMKPLIVALRNAARHGDLRSLYYDSIQGVAALREQVARLLLDSGCQIGPDQLLITTGCQEAISAGLRAVCQPGDIVAVDSPLLPRHHADAEGPGYQGAGNPPPIRSPASAWRRWRWRWNSGRSRPSC